MKKYIIPKGFHYSNFVPSIKCLRKGFNLEYTFEFTESCRYGISEKSCVNKLFGFCFGFGVHKNSVRFGWTYVDEINMIFVYSYVYSNGHLTKHKVYELEIGEQRTFRIELLREECPNNWCYRLLIDGIQYEIGEISDKKKFATTLGPYFGGNTRAPHKIVIKEL